MKTILIGLVMCLLSTGIYSQDECIDMAYLGKPLRKLQLSNLNGQIAQQACDKFAALQFFTVLLDGESWDYKFQSCNPDDGTVLFIPDPDNSPPNQSYEILEFVFPDGSFIVYNLQDSGNSYTGPIQTCQMLPPRVMPTLSQWGLMVLALISLIIGVVTIKRPTLVKN